MLTNEQIKEWAFKEAGNENLVDALASGWAQAGAIWANKQNAAEITELREALQALFNAQNGPPLVTPRAKMDWLIAYTNAGELLKKYEQ